MSILDQAITVAKQNLRLCYGQHGILAGRHHFTDYWARDGFFAAFGSMSIGDFEIVEKMVKTFFSFQRNDGLIPYRIMTGPVTIGKYFGLGKKWTTLKPTYKLRGYGAEILDGCTLTVILLSELGIGGWKDSKNFISHAKKVLGYLKTREKFELLWDGAMTEWNDSVYKSGTLLYSNVLYWRAVKRFSKLLSKLKDSESPVFEKKSEDIAAAIRRRLWNGEFFADWYDWKKQNYFYPFGNLMAVAWRLTNKSETESIFRETEESKIGFTLETNTPAYPWWRVWWLSRLAGMADYQNHGLLWWQPGLAYILALKQVGLAQQTKVILEIMAKKIVADGEVYECYERNGLSVKRLFYRAEHPFAWGAGIFLWSVGLSEIF